MDVAHLYSYILAAVRYFVVSLRRERLARLVCCPKTNSFNYLHFLLQLGVAGALSPLPLLDGVLLDRWECITNAMTTNEIWGSQSSQMFINMCPPFFILNHWKIKQVLLLQKAGNYNFLGEAGLCLMVSIP